MKIYPFSGEPCPQYIAFKSVPFLCKKKKNSLEIPYLMFSCHFSFFILNNVHQSGQKSGIFFYPPELLDMDFASSPNLAFKSGCPIHFKKSVPEESKFWPVD